VLSEENVVRYVKAMLPVALLLVLVPLGDITLRSFQTEAGSLQWRFGLVGLLFGNLGTIVLGMSLAGFVFAVTGRRTALRALGILAIVLATVIVALMVLFALDAVQMRRLVALPVRRGVLLSSAGAALSATLAAIALAVVGRGALVVARTERLSAQRRTKAAPAPLVATSAPAAPMRERAASETA
jgi:hypothetical protein